MSRYRWQFLLVALAGWINRQQQDVIAYLKEENRVQRELLGGRRPRFSDDHRRRLAAKAKVLGRFEGADFHRLRANRSCLRDAFR